MDGEPLNPAAIESRYTVRCTCTHCHRTTCAEDLEGKPCDMPQPDGTKCYGVWTRDGKPKIPEWPKTADGVHILPRMVIFRPSKWSGSNRPRHIFQSLVSAVSYTDDAVEPDEWQGWWVQTKNWGCTPEECYATHSGALSAPAEYGGNP